MKKAYAGKFTMVNLTSKESKVFSLDETMAIGPAGENKVL